MFIKDVASQNTVTAAANPKHFPESVGRYAFRRVEVQRRFEHASIRVEVLRRVDQGGEEMSLLLLSSSSLLLLLLLLSLLLLLLLS